MQTHFQRESKENICQGHTINQAYMCGSGRASPQLHEMGTIIPVLQISKPQLRKVNRLVPDPGHWMTEKDIGQIQRSVSYDQTVPRETKIKLISNNFWRTTW